MDKNEMAMNRAIEHARLAEEATTPEVANGQAAIAAVYVSMARELRLGRIKSRTYGRVGDPGPLPEPEPEPESVKPGVAPVIGGEEQQAAPQV